MTEQPEARVMPSVLPEAKHPQVKQLYSLETAEVICDHYSEGNTLAAICRLPGMPKYKDVTRWLRHEPGFREQIDKARESRGIILEELALEEAFKAEHKDDTGPQRLKFDALKWAAEMNDPSRYGKRITHAGDATRPIQFIISTGFNEPNEFQQPPKLGTDGLIIRSENTHGGNKALENRTVNEVQSTFCSDESTSGGTDVTQGFSEGQVEAGLEFPVPEVQGDLL